MTDMHEKIFYLIYLSITKKKKKKQLRFGVLSQNSKI